MKNLMPVMVAFALLLVSQGAYAQEAAASGNWGWGVGTGLTMGIAVLGGTLSQGNAAKGYYESISRNPQSAEKMGANFILGLALIESLVLFAFVVAMTMATTK